MDVGLHGFKLCTKGTLYFKSSLGPPPNLAMQSVCSSTSLSTLRNGQTTPTGPYAFFLAWGGWRQRGGCAGFFCRTGQVRVRERGRGRWVCFREEGTSVKGAGSGRGGGEVRDLKSGVVGCGSGRGTLLQTVFGKVLEKDCRLVVLHTPPPHTEIRTQTTTKTWT